MVCGYFLLSLQSFMDRTRKKIWREIRDFFVIALGMLIGSAGWCLFLLPNHITMGGLTGVSSVVFWGMGIPVHYTFFVCNAILLALALKSLGLKFCLRTIYAVTMFTLFTGVLQGYVTTGDALFSDQKFIACLVGSVMLGTGTGMALLCNASSGGSDVIAAIVHKYRDFSLGHVILVCDVCIVTSSYLVLRSWEQVIYGYIVLFILTFCVDYVINGVRSSVQFFIVSDKWEEIGQAINNDVERGCTVIDAHGFYTGKAIGMLFVIARRSESRSIFQVVNDIDPGAFVSQSAVSGVYGMGFDRIKVKRRNGL